MAMEIIESGPQALIAAGAGTTTVGIGDIPAHESQGTYNLERVTVTSQTLITANSLATFNVRQMRAGSAVATVATLLVAANLPAEVPVVIPVSATVPVLLPGDFLDCTYVQTSTGLALTVGWEIHCEID
jgi:hypothetical protein